MTPIPKSSIQFPEGNNAEFCPPPTAWERLAPWLISLAIVAACGFLIWRIV